MSANKNMDKVSIYNESDKVASKLTANSESSQTESSQSASIDNQTAHIEPNQTNKLMRRSSSSSATTSRQWELLNQLERSRWRGTHYLHEQLQLANYDVSLRTVQRDLNALSKRFPIEKNNANPQGWRWKEDAPVQSLPHMNFSQAVAFNMVEANLTQLLPPAILKELFPWFNLARRQLKGSKVSHNWLDRVRIEPPTQPLIAPDIDIDCKDAIYEALFHERQIIAKYIRRNQEHAGDYVLNPLSIIQRGVVIYLLATRIDDPESVIRTFALHRFTEVSVSDKPALIPNDFDLNAYLDAGGMGFAHYLFKDLPNRGKNCRVTLTFKNKAAMSLIESRLSKDQLDFEDEVAGTQTIVATVNLTSQLVWWLRGFGNKLIKIEPEILAQAVNTDY